MSRADDVKRANLFCTAHETEIAAGDIADLIAAVRAETRTALIQSLIEDAEMSTEPVRGRLLLHAAVLRGENYRAGKGSAK